MVHVVGNWENGVDKRKRLGRFFFLGFRSLMIYDEKVPTESE